MTLINIKLVKYMNSNFIALKSTSGKGKGNWNKGLF